MTVIFFIAGKTKLLATQEPNTTDGYKEKYKSDYHDVPEFGGRGIVGYDLREADK